MLTKITKIHPADAFADLAEQLIGQEIEFVPMREFADGSQSGCAFGPGAEIVPVDRDGDRFFAKIWTEPKVELVDTASEHVVAQDCETCPVRYVCPVYRELGSVIKELESIE